MTPVEILFEKLAFTTWDAIENAYGNRISFGEDAITSINLLALKNASFPTIAIEDTRPSESTKGCDFEFWIGTHKSGWYRFDCVVKIGVICFVIGPFQCLHIFFCYFAEPLRKRFLHVLNGNKLPHF